MRLAPLAGAALAISCAACAAPRHDAAPPATAPAPRIEQNYAVGGQNYAEPRLMRRLIAGDVRTWAIAFSPDGEWFATGSESGVVKVWRTADFTRGELAPAHVLDNHTNRVYDLVFDPTGPRLISASRDGNVIVWSLENGQMVYALPHPWEIRAVALSPDGRTLVAGQLGGTRGVQMPTIHIWDMESGQKVRNLEHIAPCADLSFSPDGVLLAMGLIDGEPSMLADTETWADVLPLGRRGVWANRVTFDPTGRHLALATVRSPLESQTVGKIQLWNARTGDELDAIEAASGPVGLEFSPDGRYVSASYPDEKRIRIWDVDSRELISELIGGSTTALSFSPDGKILAACSPNDGSVELWAFGTGDPSEISLSSGTAEDADRQPEVVPVVPVGHGDLDHGEG